MRIRRVKTVDFPRRQSGQRSFTLTFPLEDGTYLQVSMGMAGMEAVHQAARETMCLLSREKLKTMEERDGN